MKSQINVNTILNGVILAALIWVGGSIQDVRTRVARIEERESIRFRQLDEFSRSLEAIQRDVDRLKK